MVCLDPCEVWCRANHESSSDGGSGFEAIDGHGEEKNPGLSVFFSVFYDSDDQLRSNDPRCAAIRPRIRTYPSMNGSRITITTGPTVPWTAERPGITVGAEPMNQIEGCFKSCALDGPETGAEQLPCCEHE